MSPGKPKFDPRKHHRRSIRLKGYDYSSEGAYYITIVTQGRKCIFGEIVDGEIQLNDYGEIVQKWWNEIPKHFPKVELGAHVIMPNHIHGIVFITTERRGEVVSPHDNYYEHIVRDEKDLRNKTDYIHANPSLWDEDNDNLKNIQTD